MELKRNESGAIPNSIPKVKNEGFTSNFLRASKQNALSFAKKNKLKCRGI